MEPALTAHNTANNIHEKTHRQPQNTESPGQSPKTRKNPPHSMVPKVAETNQPMKVLRAVPTRVSLGAGRRWAAVPPPYPPPPLVYTPRGKDLAQGSGLFRAGPSVARAGACVPSPRCGDAPSWPHPTAGAPPLGIPGAKLQRRRRLALFGHGRCSDKGGGG